MILLFGVECERHCVGLVDYSCPANPGRKKGPFASFRNGAAPSRNGKCALCAVVTIVVKLVPCFRFLLEGLLLSGSELRRPAKSWRLL